jgi:hypothetical protein
LACHPQINPDPAYHSDEDPDMDPADQFDADPDPTFQFDTDPLLERHLGFGFRSQNYTYLSKNINPTS